MIFRRFVHAMFCGSWCVLPTKLQKLTQPSESGSSTSTHDEEPKGKMSWEDFYMNVAVLAAQRSNDPDTQVGAVLVDERKRIIGIGWNDMPTGFHDNNKLWLKNKEDHSQDKHSYVCHAEFNAMALSPVNQFDGTKVKLYTTLFTCIGCAKIVVQHGIKKVYYLSDKKAAKEEFKNARKLYEEEATYPVVRTFDFREEFRKNKETAPVELDFTFMERESKASEAEPTQKKVCLGKPSPEEPKKGEREGIISCEDFYMGLAILASKKSAHQDTKVGAVLVNDMEVVVGIGWNDFPTNVNPGEDVEGHAFDCHAAANAIVFKTASVNGAKLYTTFFPCNECMKLIIQSGIKEICYLSAEPDDDDEKKWRIKAAREMLNQRNTDKIEKIVERKFDVTPTRKKTPIKLNFGYLDEST